MENKTYCISVLGLFSAFVFISSMISFPIPVGIGDPTRIHLGNTFCLLSGLILGPVGGLAAGIGSAFYDLTNPLYIETAPFTFISKFAMAFVCSKIAYMNNKKGTNVKLNVIAGIVGILTYMVLYLGRNFFMAIYFKEMAVNAALVEMATRAVTSTINGIIAVCIAVPLNSVLKKALKSSNIFDKIKF